MEHSARSAETRRDPGRSKVEGDCFRSFRVKLQDSDLRSGEEVGSSLQPPLLLHPNLSILMKLPVTPSASSGSWLRTPNGRSSLANTRFVGTDAARMQDSYVTAQVVVTLR